MIFIERDLNEILDSQAQMLRRRKEQLPDTPERRDLLRRAYAKTVVSAKAFLRRRPEVRLLVLQRSDVLRDAAHAAEAMASGGSAPPAAEGRIDRGGRRPAESWLNERLDQRQAGMAPGLRKPSVVTGLRLHHSGGERGFRQALGTGFTLPFIFRAIDQ